MSEQEIPVEVYRAFASTKPTEFDAYVRKWREEHPEPTTEPTAEATPIVEEPAKKTSRRKKTEPDLPDEEPVEVTSG